MWRRLALSSLGVIDQAELPLEPGFTVITGETGAGKTMVVTALGLLRGERADPGLVRHGAQQARVEASIEVAPNGPVAQRAREAGAVLDEDSKLILGRSIAAHGRSRAFAGGASVPAAVLTSLTDELVAVHGQSDQHRLTKSDEQRRALDHFAGDAVAHLLGEYAPAYQRWREVEAQLVTLRTTAQERAREHDELVHGLEQIDAVSPVAGETIELESAENRLAHAESLARAAHLAHVLLAGDVDDVGSAARQLLAQAAAELQHHVEYDTELAALHDRAQDLSLSAQELASDLASYAASIEVDPAGLSTIQARRAQLQALQRKYGPTLDEVMAWADQARTRVLDLGHDDETISELESESTQLESRLIELAHQLRQARQDAGTRLAEQVGHELNALSMKSARIVVEVRDRDLGPHGGDAVEVLFAANSGAAPRPLAKGASGGELSRLMLALEVVLAEVSDVPTLVFDEVDAGIGGRAAVEVGRRLAQLSDRAQVLAVTHLPQVAAFAQHHFRVLKDDDGMVTSSSVVRLDGAARVEELARMLAGVEGSDAARDHARELLDMATGNI